MSRLGLAFLLCVGIAALVALTRDPEEPWAVGIFIVAVGTAAAILAAWLQLRRAATRRRAARVEAVAGRRGLEVGAVVALILWLRAVDGLSLVTAAFVIATFAAAEYVLAARPHSSR